MNSYEVSLEKFEGPLDLLIHLIQKNKIDIYDIKTTLESYMDQLKSELNIQVYEKKVQ